MPWSEPTYSLTLDITGVRFYGSDARIISAEASLSIESDLQVLGLEILKPNIVISGEVTTTVSAFKYAFASVEIDGFAITVTAGTEIVKALIAPSASVSLAVSGTKIAYADSSISVESDTSASALEILFGYIVADSEVVVSSTAYEILHVNSSISADSDVAVSALEILLTGSSSSIESSVSASALEILLASSSIDSNSDVSVSSLKFAFASSILTGDCNASITSLKIAFSQSEINATSNTSIVGTEILFAKIDASGFVVTVTVGKEILFINPEPTGAATIVSIDAIRFSPTLVEDTQSIRTLLLLDGRPLSEHGRTLSSTVVHSFVENKNWSARKTRYYKTNSGRKSFSINWTMLPSKMDQTVDKKLGRDNVKEIVKDPDLHVLTVINNDTDGLTPYTETDYNVFIKGYSESLVRRDVNGDSYFWNCSLEMEEV